jgi:hypothetical protein
MDARRKKIFTGEIFIKTARLINGLLWYNIKESPALSRTTYKRVK